MTRDEKLKSIETFEHAYDAVEKLLEGKNSALLAFVPPLADAWSITDFLVHFLDADISLSYRIRTAVAEPGNPITLWEEEAWQKNLAYSSADPRACLSLAKGLRSVVAASLRSKLDDDWSGFFIQHPSKGRVQLEDLLGLAAGHVAFHIPLIERNLRAWQEKAGSK